MTPATGDANRPLRRDLDCPQQDADIYDAVGEDVDDLRPVCQGDVYRGLTLPGYPGDDHELVMLAQHPCSLREGATLRAMVQAVPVRSHTYLPPRRWTGHGKLFPLPVLEGDEHLAADLAGGGVIRSGQLVNAERVITLSQLGILLLQQRIVWTGAHTLVELATFEEYNAPALTELELLQDWNELICADLTGDERGAALLQTAADFEAFLRDSGLQQRLADPPTRADARAQIRLEGRRRADV